jgi:hypothetical protein
MATQPSKLPRVPESMKEIKRTEEKETGESLVCGLLGCDKA